MIQIETSRGPLDFEYQEELLGFYAVLYVIGKTKEIKIRSNLKDRFERRLIHPIKPVTLNSTFPDSVYSEQWASSNYRILLLTKKPIFLAFENPVFLRGIKRAQEIFETNFEFKVWSSDGQPRVQVSASSPYYPFIRSN